jgi:type IV fimbrial biogenesis protein FimT
MSICPKSGFSLSELLVALALLSTLTSLALPSLGQRLEQARQATLHDNLARTIQLARTQAVQQRRRIELCALGSSEQCGQDWSNGWLTRDVASSEVLQVYPLQPGESLLQWSGLGPSIRFLPDGSTPLSNGRFFQCHAGQPAWQLVISRQGRLRSSSASENQREAGRCR